SVLLEIRKKFNGYVFLVDGFSTDNTVNLARKNGIDVFFRNNHGKGSAIQKALEIANSKKIEYLLFFDCDQTYSANDIEKFLFHLPSSDLVIGVRNLKSIKPFSRRLGNIVATKLINLALKGNIKDSISGFKGIRVSSFYQKIHENGFVADALICVIALNNKLKIEHVEIEYNERVGKSKMNLLIGLIELFKLLFSISKILMKKL
ncbi:MAG: glycosyltransferase family 2 protein, partial [Flavobacteriales bacterium]|nr:glycosyltransferase family 2 protein [Flavobacteriales bacterium]